ncbi:hypothetical protein KCU88_g4520, partial [Aureobasidium melanogenum]
MLLLPVITAIYLHPYNTNNKCFASPIIDQEAEAAKKKKEQMDREIEKIKQEYEEKQRKKKAAKSNDKDKKKDSNDDDGKAEKERDDKAPRRYPEYPTLMAHEDSAQILIVEQGLQTSGGDAAAETIQLTTTVVKGFRRSTLKSDRTEKST